MISANTREYFSRVADSLDHWQEKNAYYHEHIRSLIQGMVPPHRNVLEIGCGTGNLLASLQPQRESYSTAERQ